MVDARAYAHAMRRDELAALGIQLPVLPAIALGPLPGAPAWAARLARIGLDVAASGAERDTAATIATARAAAPHLPLKARAADAGALDGLAPLIVESDGAVPAGHYRLGPDEDLIAAVDGRDGAVEDPNDVARRALARAREGTASALWVAATPGLDDLPEDVAEAKLAALVEGARQARLWLAKEQFDRDDPGPSWGPRGYAGSGSASSTAPDRGGPLEGRWTLTGAGGKIDAVFADGRVSGNAGVNAYTGPYAATAAGDLDIGQLATTRKAGPPAAAEAERAYLAALRGVTSYRSDGRALTLFSPGGLPTLAYERSEGTVVGSWQVTGFNNGRQAVVSVLAGSAISAAFVEDGTLTGDAGVNAYRTSYTISPDGTGISVSPAVTTRMAGRQELMDQERDYLRALESAATFTVRGSKLELRDGADAIAVTMRRS